MAHQTIFALGVKFCFIPPPSTTDLDVTHSSPKVATCLVQPALRRLADMALLANFVLV